MLFLKILKYVKNILGFQTDFYFIKNYKIIFKNYFKK